MNTLERHVVGVVAQWLSLWRWAAVLVSLAAFCTAPVLADTVVGDASPRMALKRTSITIPGGCVVDPPSQVSTTKSCHLAADAAGSSLKVQLDEAVVPLDLYMDPPWTPETVVAAMTGPFFSSWLKGSTQRTPINTITSAPVPEEDLPPGMTACRSYSFDRSDPGVQMHIREFGLFCIRLQEPVQHPLLLVGSVQLTMYDGRSETYPSEFDAMSEAILATYRIDGARSSRVPAEPLVPKTLYFTAISVPTVCNEIPLKDSGVWRCSVTLGADVNLDVQLDEILVPMEQISNRIWTNEDVVAELTGPFFQNWMQGATASTPGAMTRSQVVADEDLPAGMAACNDYRFDRHQSGALLHIVEIGRFCVMTRNPVQWPYVLIGSVSLLDYQARGGPFAESDMARAEAILSTYRRAAP